MIRAFAIPLRTRFRGVTRRSGLLLHGPCGWGEFSPFPEYPPGVAARWLAAAREAATAAWPPPVRDRIQVNVTVPAVGAEQAYEIVARSGCTTAKVKVAARADPARPALEAEAAWPALEAEAAWPALEAEPARPALEADPARRERSAEAADVVRVEAVRAALGPHGRIRVDANGAWDVEQAVRMIRRLAEFDLEYVEQPVATLEEMARLRTKIDVPLAADESVRTAHDPLRIAGLTAADVVVLKAQPLGGVAAAMRVAEAAALPVVVSSALETSVGLAAGLALAAALPELPYACGLATLDLLEGDVVADPLLPVGGEIAVSRPEPDPQLLERWATSEAEERALLARLAAADAWR